MVLDIQLNPSWLVSDSELVNAAYRVQRRSDKCCVCMLWGEREGEITGYKKQDTVSQPRQKRQNLRDVFSECMAGFFDGTIDCATGLCVFKADARVSPFVHSMLRLEHVFVLGSVFSNVLRVFPHWKVAVWEFKVINPDLTRCRM